MFDSHGLHLTALTRCQLHLPTALLWAGAGAPRTNSGCPGAKQSVCSAQTGRRMLAARVRPPPARAPHPAAPGCARRPPGPRRLAQAPRQPSGAVASGRRAPRPARRAAPPRAPAPPPSSSAARPPAPARCRRPLMRNDCALPPTTFMCCRRSERRALPGTWRPNAESALGLGRPGSTSRMCCHRSTRRAPARHRAATAPGPGRPGARPA